MFGSAILSSHSAVFSNAPCMFLWVLFIYISELSRFALKTVKQKHIENLKRRGLGRDRGVLGGDRHALMY